MRDLAIARVGVDAEVHVPIGGVGEAVGEQRADELLHLRDVLGRARIVVRRQPVERRHLGQEGRHPSVSEGEIVLAGLARLAQHVVVHIGQVLDVDDVMAQVLEVPMQDVEADVGEGVPEVAGVVGGHAADVQADPIPAGDGLERVKSAPAGVVEAKGHAADSKAVGRGVPETGRDR